MIYLSNEPYPQEISVPRSFGVIVPQRNTYLSTADIAADLTTDSDTKVLAASQGVVLKEMVDAKADASDVYTKQEVDEALAGKQDELVAGDNITIEGNVISATGGGSGDSYTRAETDALLAEKADADDVYTKAQVDGALAGKADATDIPTKTSDLTNDSGFVTGQEVSQVYETKSDATAKETALQNAINRKQDILTFDNVPTNGSSNPVKSDGIYDALGTKQPNISDLQTIRSGAAAGATAVQPAELQTALLEKQDRLISGQNIKTINNTSLLGSGNIVIQGGGGGTIDNEVTKDSANAVKSSGIYDALGKYGVISQTQTWTGGSSTGYTYTMSNQVWGLIPQANIDLYESAGAVFNETTGYFELNGLTDISYEEMRDIYLFANLGNGAKNTMGFLQGNSRRTNISTWEGAWNHRLVCTQILLTSDLESFRYGAQSLRGAGSIYTNANCNWMFQSSRYLRKISELNMENTTSATSAFDQCPSLEEVLITKLKISISFPASLKLTASSVAHMINNVGTTNAITITLHATAYARAIADSDVQAALAAKTNVTLASA